MKKRFTRILAALALLVGLTIPMGVWGQSDGDVTVTWTATAANNFGATIGTVNASNTGTISTGDFGWDYTNTLTYLKSGKSDYQAMSNGFIQIGSSNAYHSLILTTDEFTNIIKSVSVECSSASGAHKLTVTVGSEKYIDSENTPSGAPSSTGNYLMTGTGTSTGDITISFVPGSGALYIKSISVTYEDSNVPTLLDNNLALVNAPVALAFDLYNNASAQVISYTTSSTGTVSVQTSDYITAVVNETAKTITVTPVAVTPEAQTITVSQEADDTYAAGEATFTVSIANSTPYVQPTTVEIIPNYTFWGKTAQFSGTDFDELSGSKDNVSLDWTRGSGSTYANQNAMRFYKDNTLTFTAPEGYEIISIVLTVSGTYEDLTFSPTGYNNENTTWTGAAETVTMSRPSNASSYATISKFTITLAAIGNAVTTTTTINVPQNFNTDIHEGTTAGTLTATVMAGETQIDGAAVTWESSNTDVATIDANGAVTLVAVGTTTITASYAGVEDQYRPSEGTYELTVTDSNAPGTQNNPYTVAQARAAIDAGTGTQGVYATGIVSSIETAWSTQYNNITFNFVDNGGDTDFLQAFRCGSGTGVDASTVAVGDIVVVHGDLTKYGSTYEFGQGCELVSLEHPTTPFVTVTPSTINAPFAGAEGTLALTYENIEEFISFDYYFCDAEGNELEDTNPNYPDWIDAEIQEENETYSLYYVIGANDGDARTAYIKVYTFDDELEEVYAIVTVNQAKYVADYATLPFEFDGGKADIETTNGLTQTGLGTDFGSSPKLRFDTQDDNLVLKINEAPGVLTFDIKGTGNSGDWSGTFVVQASADGSTYTNIATYTDLTRNETEEKTIDNLASNVRYIRWYFSEKASGYNVALGNINLAAVPAGYPLTINGYGTSAGGYVLIASPISTTPDAVGMITDELGANVTPETSTYDLYSYDENFDEEWRNYRANINSFQLVPGKGYLYASKKDVTLYFNGEMSTGFIDVTLPYNASDFTKSIYLAGNSLTEDQTFYVYDDNLALQTVNYLTLNEDGDQFVVAQADSYTASALQGFFVQAAGSGWTLSTEDLSEGTSGNQGASLLNVKVMRNAGSLIDNAIVSFSNGSMMNKFYLSDNTTRVYIPQGNREMAVVNSAAEGEMPVSFKASENGTYSLSIEAENVNMNYLHLIDNMTGADVDLLQTPSYTFEAKTSDYASRFRLVFKANGTNENNAETFAYFNGTNWTVSNVGDATLQVVDVTGRTVANQMINGNAELNLNQPAGVYVIRLVNGDNVKTQKVVVR